MADNESEASYASVKELLDYLNRLYGMSFGLPTGSASQLAFENSFPIMRAIKRQAVETITELMRDMGNEILGSQNSGNSSSAACHFRPEPSPLDVELLIDINDKIITFAEDQLKEFELKESSAAAAAVVQEVFQGDDQISRQPIKTFVPSFDLNGEYAWVVRTKTVKGNKKNKLSQENITNSNDLHDGFILKAPHEELKIMRPERPQFRIELASSDNQKPSFDHPYQEELDQFHPTSQELTTPSVTLASLVEISKQPEFYCISPLSIIEIRDAAGLSNMLEHLLVQKEIAVDLEHHSYHSFLGYTCLIQISTRTQDYIIDPLPMSKTDLQQLNRVFLNPSIVKVIHGAQNDLQWLQRDFGVFIINLFDTFFAARKLHYPRLSYQYLLERFCHLEINKRFQMADWRLRPLPMSYKLYACADTHYLLHIYDALRIALGDTQQRFEIWNESRNLCLHMYKPPKFEENSYSLLCHNWSILAANPVQRQVFKKLFAWRWRVAEKRDESFHAVLPDDMMKRIAQELPREHTGLLACCNPPPMLLKNNSDCRKEILDIIAETVINENNTIKDSDDTDLGQGVVQPSNQSSKYAHAWDSYRPLLTLDLAESNTTEESNFGQNDSYAPLWKISSLTSPEPCLMIKEAKSSGTKAAALSTILVREREHLQLLYKWSASCPAVVPLNDMNV